MDIEKQKEKKREKKRKREGGKLTWGKRKLRNERTFMTLKKSNLKEKRFFIQ